MYRIEGERKKTVVEDEDMVTQEEYDSMEEELRVEIASIFGVYERFADKLLSLVYDYGEHHNVLGGAYAVLESVRDDKFLSKIFGEIINANDTMNKTKGDYVDGY